MAARTRPSRRPPAAARLSAVARTRPCWQRDTASQLPAELLVLDPVRNDGVGAEPPHLVLLVVLKVSLEPLDVALAFEREDVRRYAVEEPAIMADDDGATGEILQRFF